LEGETRPRLSILPEVKVSSDKFGERATAAIADACKALIEAEPKLTEWDTIVGDGDCGLTMARGALKVHNHLKDGKLSVEMPSRLLSQLADAVSASMGGTSGILFELMLRRASTYLANADGPIDDAIMGKAFADGVRAGSYYGGAKIGYRTMMDALLPAADAADQGLGFDAIAKAACDGADSTASMKSAFAGRSNYLSEEQLKDTPDPGAKAVAIILSAAAGVV
jgi:dihydroxyacetone kinase